MLFEGHGSQFEELGWLSRLAARGKLSFLFANVLCIVFSIQALDIIENSNVSYFNKETSADLYALKGIILSHMQRYAV